MSAQGRAIARRDEASVEWFDALGEGRLLLRACPAGHLSRPDVLACDLCGEMALAWEESGGRGSIVSLAVDHSGSASTLLAIVELSEGPWLLTSIEGRQVERGEQVVVRVVQPVQGDPYPVATAADGSE